MGRSRTRAFMRVHSSVLSLITGRSSSGSPSGSWRHPSYLRSTLYLGPQYGDRSWTSPTRAVERLPGLPHHQTSITNAARCQRQRGPLAAQRRFGQLGRQANLSYQEQLRLRCYQQLFCRFLINQQLMKKRK